jgi:DNA-directed RNA polymerase specialized sigma24 family protein
LPFPKNFNLKTDGKSAMIQSLWVIEEDHNLQNQLANEDACELIEKLTAHAVRVLAEYGIWGQDGTVSGIGKSAEDFAYETLEDYLTGKIKTRDLAYLCTALRNNVIDKLRSASHQTTDHLPVNKQDGKDSEGTKYLDGFTSQSIRPDEYLCEQSFQSRVRACVAAEPRLRELVEAIFDLGLLTPREIAEALDVTATEIYVRKKQLKRRLIALGIPEVPLEK